MQPLVTDGVEGRIVPAFRNEALVEAMKELANDIDMRQKMSKAAIMKANSLSAEIIAEKWFDLFTHLSPF